MRARLGALLAVALLASAPRAAPGSTNQASGEQRAADAKHATKELAEAEAQGPRLRQHRHEPRQARDHGRPSTWCCSRTRTRSPSRAGTSITFTFEPTGADMPPGYTIEYQEGPFVEGDEGQFTVETLGERVPLHHVHARVGDRLTRRVGRARPTRATSGSRSWTCTTPRSCASSSTIPTARRAGSSGSTRSGRSPSTRSPTPPTASRVSVYIMR